MPVSNEVLAAETGPEDDDGGASVSEDDLGDIDVPAKQNTFEHQGGCTTSTCQHGTSFSEKACKGPGVVWGSGQKQ